MELTAILSVIRAHARMIVACVLISTGVALAVSLVMPPSYEASTKLIVGPALNANVNDLNQLLSSQQIAQTYAEAAQTQELARQVVADLGLDTAPEALLKQVAVEVSATTPVISIRATDNTAGTSAAIANDWAKQLIAKSDAIQGQNAELKALLEKQIATANEQIAALNKQILALQNQPSPSAGDAAQLALLSQQLVTDQATLATLLQTQAAQATSVISVLDPATVPTDRSSPKLTLNVALGLALGLLLGLILAFALASLDDTFKTAEDIEGVLRLPVLGTLGRLPEAAQRVGIYRLVMLLYPRSGAAEAFRTLRTNVEFADVDAGVRSLLVTSPGANEGKSTVAANLALAFAQAGRRTILVDADLRQPAIHDYFDLTNTYGLTNLIRSQELLELSKVVRTVDEPNLRVVTSGPLPPNPAELLGSQRMQAVIERLKAEADLVVFDSPPAPVVTDAAVLASLVDETILVVVAGRTRRGAARRAEEALTRVGAHIVGVVLNRPAGRTDEASYDSYPYQQPDAEASAGNLASAPKSAR
ncbi:MAG: polysaccharide biosynthesis tyrosine autokinase [Candidatus Limnocylindrales bacterium]